MAGGWVLALLVSCSGDTKPDEPTTGDGGVKGETSVGGEESTSNGGAKPGSNNPGATSDPDNSSAGTVGETEAETTGSDTSTQQGLPTGGEDTGPVEIPNDGELRAFPGASGFAAMATGGRGGQVIKVTTLADSGPGSFREAITTSGPRIIVFEVSGVIETESILEIYSGDVTIAGQTAPGGGITIKGRLYGSYDDSVGNMIVRHVRIRPEYDGSEGSQFDALQFSRNHTLMFDHVSVAFGVDENVDLYSSHNVTFQWSTVEDPGTRGHDEGEHNYGLINGPDGQYVAVHHNLFAHARNRSPAIANGPADILNNVIYNAAVGFVHHNPPSGQFRLIGNYFKDGPSANLMPFYFDDYALDGLRYYVADNWAEGNTECEPGELDNPWRQCEDYNEHDESYRSNSDFDFSDVGEYRPTPITSAQQAYADILAKAGAFPRDVVTRRVLQELASGTGEWGTPTPDDLMEGLTPTQPPEDNDDDGMADSWERSHGLDPSNGDDHAAVMDSGYTAIEEYINELAERLIQ